MLQFELFTAVPVAPERLWALVGDVRRIPEWTDADHVMQPPEPPLEVGARFTTVDAGRELRWVVITVADRLIEAKTDDGPCGRFGVGVRVAPDPIGSRLILAGLLDPSGSRVRARVQHLPALRSRAERWADLALRAVAAVDE
jgi:hypothetical protein